MKLKYYLASQFENMTVMQFLANHINKEYDLECMSYWLYRDTVSFTKDVELDFTSVERSDFMISIFPWYKGALCEMSYAIGLNKPVIAVVNEIFFPKFSDIKKDKYSDFFPLAKFEFWSNICKAHEILHDYPWVIVRDMKQLDECVKYRINLLKSIQDEKDHI